MSNRDDDFRFDDDDDLFRSDDNSSSDFRNFDEFDDSVDLDNDDIFGLDDDEISDEEIDAEEGEGGGGNRTFVILAVVLAVLLLCGVGVLIFALVQGRPDPLAPTRTAIAIQNATTIANLQTQDANATIVAIETATAMSFTATPSPTLTPSATFTPEIDFTATANFLATQNIASISGTATQASVQLTAQAQGVLDGTNVGQGGGETDDPTPTSEVVLQPISGSAVDQTATALADILRPIDVTSTPATGGQLLPTPTAITGIRDITGNGGGQLPDTGLFDELAAGNPLVIFGIVFGLLAVIILSRVLRGK